MRIPWVELEPMFFVLRALERILRMPAATNGIAEHRASRHVTKECRQWKRDLLQSVELAYSFWSTVPMVARAILPLKQVLNQQVTGVDKDGGELVAK